MGYWDASGFSISPRSSATSIPSPYSTRDAAGAPFSDSEIDALACKDPQHKDQNYLIACYADDKDRFVVFEQFF